MSFILRLWNSAISSHYRISRVLSISTSVYVGGWRESGRLVAIEELHKHRPWCSEVLEGVASIQIDDIVFLGPQLWGAVDQLWLDVAGCIEDCVSSGAATEVEVPPGSVYFRCQLGGRVLSITQAMRSGSRRASVDMQELLWVLGEHLFRFWSLVAQRRLLRTNCDWKIDQAKRLMAMSGRQLEQPES